MTLNEINITCDARTLQERAKAQTTLQQTIGWHQHIVVLKVNQTSVYVCANFRNRQTFDYLMVGSYTCTLTRK